MRRGAAVVPAFRPRCSDTLEVAGVCYRFVPHPLLPGDDEMPLAIEGGEAIIFPLRAEGGAMYALRVPKPAFRSDAAPQVAAVLATLAALPGWGGARRTLLLPATHPDVLARHPALAGASLMPWAEGCTWASVIATRSAPSYAVLLGWATALSHALSMAEARGLAHCDIAGGNVLVDAPPPAVTLLDLDGIYAPTLPPPPGGGRGTRGYAHPRPGPGGQWCAAGDRFAGAVLLTEMLVWGDPRVRAHVPQGAESLFLHEEVGMLGTPLWWAVRGSLWEHWPDMLDLFDAAWTAPTLAACPPLAAWAASLHSYMTRAGLAEVSVGAPPIAERIA